MSDRKLEEEIITNDHHKDEYAAYQGKKRLKRGHNCAKTSKSRVWSHM